jgi:hypothetical protein
MKGVGSGVGSGSISQRYEFGDRDLDPHQNVSDPQHCRNEHSGIAVYYIFLTDETRAV